MPAYDKYFESRLEAVVYVKKVFAYYKELLPRPYKRIDVEAISTNFTFDASIRFQQKWTDHQKAFVYGVRVAYRGISPYTLSMLMQKQFGIICDSKQIKRMITYNFPQKTTVPKYEKICAQEYQQVIKNLNMFSTQIIVPDKMKVFKIKHKHCFQIFSNVGSQMTQIIHSTLVNKIDVALFRNYLLTLNENMEFENNENI
jgi:hypothetical protein